MFNLAGSFCSNGLVEPQNSCSAVCKDLTTVKVEKTWQQDKQRTKKKPSMLSIFLV
jgi:hypothetical protein